MIIHASAALLAVAALLAAVPLALGQTTQPTEAGFTNPLKVDGADPWLVYHNGYYHLTTTTARDIQMRRATTLNGLKTAEDVVIWKDDTPGRAGDIWATEFHRLPNEDGEMRWYGYYTAAHPRDEPSHRMFALESEGDDPMGPYTFKAQVQTDANDEHYSIDGSPFEAGGELYFTWCGRPSEAGQGIYIRRMTNAWTTEGDRTYLETDGFGCQWVREAPVALKRDGKVYLIYSMCSAETPDYRLGMLVADENDDLTDEASWTQYPEVVFSRRDELGVYGPGHNFFFKSPDGTQDWIVYHAKTTTERTFGDRVTLAQPFTWNDDGTPNFGRPVGFDEVVPEPSGTRTQAE